MAISALPFFFPDSTHPLCRPFPLTRHWRSDSSASLRTLNSAWLPLHVQASGEANKTSTLSFRQKCLPQVHAIFLFSWFTLAKKAPFHSSPLSDTPSCFSRPRVCLLVHETTLQSRRQEVGYSPVCCRVPSKSKRESSVALRKL